MRQAEKQIIIATLLVMFVGMPAIGFAQTAGKEVLGGIDATAKQAELSAAQEKDPTDNLAVMLGRVINYMFGVVGTVFVVVILIGGYYWMGAGGHPEHIAKAKTFILNGIFGLIVIIISYALVYAILFAVSGSTANGG